MKPSRTFEIFPDAGGKYRWRARARNGKITCISGESFDSKGNAKRAARREQAAFGGAIEFVEVAK
jgi:uncharacterized protein YegP (UPF0339 family)